MGNQKYLDRIIFLDYSEYFGAILTINSLSLFLWFLLLGSFCVGESECDCNCNGTCCDGCNCNNCTTNGNDAGKAALVCLVLVCLILMIYLPCLPFLLWIKMSLRIFLWHSD